MPYRVKDVGPSASGKTTSITLDAKNPTENYPDWRVSFDQTRNGPAPQTGMTIECEPVANAKGYYWIEGWKPAQSNGGPQQVATGLPEHVQQTINQDAPNFIEPPQAMNTVTLVDSDLNSDGDAIKQLESDPRTLSIVLQVCIKGSADPAQADAYLSWYLKRMTNLRATRGD